MAEKATCPWCGAERKPLVFSGREWKCGSFRDSVGKWQSVECKLRCRVAELEAIVGAIDELRADEGEWVMILCKNPGDSGPSQVVKITGDWTNWEPERFGGDTLTEALQAALAAKRAET